MKIKKFINPKFIAVVGASNDNKKVGRKIFDNISENKKQKVFPINIKEKKVAGKKAYSSVNLVPIKNFSELLVVIAIPAKNVLTEIEKCAEVGVKNIVIISAGFKELSEFGQKIEEEIKILAKKHKINILGPNCLGYINAEKNLNVSFSDYQSENDKKIVKKNNIAFLSQSGAIGSAVLDWLIGKNIGLSLFVSLGNKSVLNENDFLEYFYDDKKTDLVVLYLEEISQGKRFLEAVSRLSKKKPVAILKAGRTVFGEKMAISHTGSLAGSYETTLMAMERCGAIVLDSIDEIYNLMRLIKGPVKSLKGGLAIISNAGGPLVLASDKIYENNLELPNFSLKTKKGIERVISNFAHIKNPFDILGDASAKNYEDVLNVVLKDDKISFALLVLTPQSMTEVEGTAEAISKIKKKYKNKVIVTSFMGGQAVSKGKKILANNLVPNFDSVEDALSVLIKFIKYLGKRDDIKIYKSGKEELIPLLDNNKEVLDYLSSFNFLKKNKISSIETKILDDKNLKRAKYPVVIKFTGPDFLHKSDKQAIFLNVKNSQEAQSIKESFEKMISTKKISSDNKIIYQEMFDAKINDSKELILGFKRDPVFGPVILLGQGGIYAEVYRDMVLELADLDDKRAAAMIKKLKIYPILAGARGKKAVNFKILSKTILKIAEIAKKNKDILEMDINPLFIDDKNILAVDVRIIKAIKNKN